MAITISGTAQQNGKPTVLTTHTISPTAIYGGPANVAVYGLKPGARSERMGASHYVAYDGEMIQPSGCIRMEAIASAPYPL